ncbi:hypothetical protein BGZ70_007071 [Mortierella alpina]|uniref:F-box domain-containing protein n=1 Tax=Mortierella alpina TaxID=64518 RepID=A0A9P6M397_MORAP|nr:hypothetical protein BGZ70_007071 [Mortierella alpina]
MTVSLAINPLSLPEIRERIGRYLSVNDALSCVQVSKDWAKDFARPIWHTINFEAQPKFLELDPEVIQKYRHQISTVTHFKNLAHLKTLQSSLPPPQSGKFITGLAVLSGTVQSEDQSICNDLIARNSSSLTKVVLQYEHSSADGEEEDHSLETFSPIEALIPSPAGGLTMTSRLTTLRLQQYRIQRETLCMLLRGCPALETLDLLRTSVFQRLHNDNTKDEFQHSRIRYLAIDADNLHLPLSTAAADAPAPTAVPVQSLMQPTRPSLLAHFPALTTLGIDANTASELEEPEFRSEIARWCPNLRALDSYGWILSILLVNDYFETIRSVSFNHAGIDAKLVLALLNHEDTLTSVSTHTNESWGSAADETERGREEEEMIGSASVAAAPERFVESHVDSAWMVYMIPRQCPKIERMCFPEYMLDMDDIEKLPWVCEGLRDLRVRIRGLDTAEKIQTVLSTWATRRRLPKLEQKRETEEDAVKEEEEVVEATINDAAAATTTAAGSSSEGTGTANEISTATETGVESAPESTTEPAAGNLKEAAAENTAPTSASESTATGATSVTHEFVPDSQDTVKVALPLEERVVRHLLQFDHLTTVWLGYGVFRV